MLHGDLLRVAEGDLADLQVELHHEGEDEQEGDGERHGVVFGDGPADAARGLVPQTVPAKSRQQAEREARHPDEDHHHVGEGDCSFGVVGQGIVQRQIAVHCDGENVEDGRREGRNEQSDRQQRHKLHRAVDQVGEDKVQDEAKPG